MELLKGIFAIIGFLVVAGLVFIGVRYSSSLKKMDTQALGIYLKMADDIIITGDPTKSMIIKRKLIVSKNSTKAKAIENAKKIMDKIAEEHGLKKINETTMPRNGKFMKQGKHYTHIRSYCSPTIADVFLDHSDEFIGFMPCRVGMAEDKNGDVWLYTMNLDMMIHGGHTVSAELLEYANTIKEAMEQMIEKGALGKN